MSPRLNLWLVIILTVLAVWVNVPQIATFPDSLKLFGKVVDLSKVIPNLNLGLQKLTGKFPIKLGLDLQGGTELTLQTKMEKINPPDRDSALESARQVIERRVNLYGVSEALVQSSKLGEQRRILVELPGVRDASVAANLVGKTAQLDFREIPASAAAEASKSGIPLIYYASPTGLTGADLTKAAVSFNSSNKAAGPVVEIQFTSDGAKKFAEITKRNVGRPLAIFLDEQPVSAPIVNQEIIGGSAVIEGKFTTQEAKDLSIQLNAGALPVPIEILQQRSIGATLGTASVQKSLIAGIIGITTVVIFMLIYYGIYGVMADLALLVYALITLAIFRVGNFTLTLAGIAGFVLSIGMAVDANVLTFERMKEELRAGKVGKQALTAGFNRSWTSIRDSNISSLITASILYLLGTSVVKGFALTLIVGVLVSMFSAIFVTRTFLRLMPRFRK